MEWIPRYSVLTGRGGTAVYLLLKHKGSGGRLLAPANLCYAALYPALYAGWSVALRCGPGHWQPYPAPAGTGAGRASVGCGHPAPYVRPAH